MLELSKVTYWYKIGLWTKSMLKNAVSRNYLTPEQYKIVCGEDYSA